MPADHSGALEPVNAFPHANRHLVKHYFDGDAVFDRLRPYYDGQEYRFEIPTAEFDATRRFLRDHGYDLRVVDRPDRYYVGVERYSAHPENIFKASVRMESVDGHHCFCMKDRAAVQAAVADGATRLDDTPLTITTPTLGQYAEPRP